MPKRLEKNILINNMCNAVKHDSKTIWFNQLCNEFANHQLHGKQFAHLILHTKKQNIRYEQVIALIKETFSDSFIVIKQELAEETTTALTSLDSETETTITKGLHYHCFISYECANDINIHKSFRSKVQHMLKNSKRGKTFSTTDNSYMFCAYNIINNSRYYPRRDVFHNSHEEHKTAKLFSEYKCISQSVTNDNMHKILNWIAYATKTKTAYGQRAFKIINQLPSEQQQLAA